MIRIVALLILCFTLYLGCSEDSVAPEPEKISEDACTGNSSPVVEYLPDTFVALGDTIWLQAIAYDSDQDEIRFSGSCNNVTWAEIRAGILPAFGVNDETGLFLFRPKSIDIPIRIFEIYASDSCGAVGSTEFMIQVTD
jgi:hypothetical protein